MNRLQQETRKASEAAPAEQAEESYRTMVEVRDRLMAAYENVLQMRI